MFFERIEAGRHDFPHFTPGKMRDTLDIFLGHRVGVRISRFPDVIEEDLHQPPGARLRE
jgi:hypothetical protein